MLARGDLARRLALDGGGVYEWHAQHPRQPDERASISDWEQVGAYDRAARAAPRRRGADAAGRGLRTPNRPRHARIPPSTGKATPFTYDAASLASQTAAAAMSSGCPTRPAGIVFKMRAKSCSRLPPSCSTNGSRIGVSVSPGQIALHRIPLSTPARRGASA